MTSSDLRGSLRAQGATRVSIGGNRVSFVDRVGGRWTLTQQADHVAICGVGRLGGADDTLQEPGADLTAASIATASRCTHLARL